MHKNEFFIEIFENIWIDIKMYISEVSKSKISDLKPQKMIILWTLKHVLALNEHPVYELKRIWWKSFSYLNQTSLKNFNAK